MLAQGVHAAGWRSMDKKRIEKLRQTLPKLAFDVLVNKATEPPFSGNWRLPATQGTYLCRSCEHPLFHSGHQFEAGCGWPSFDRELPGDVVLRQPDYSHGMVRMEICCAHCDAHLGHVFDDGPTETGERYCVNSVALIFRPDGAQE